MLYSILIYGVEGVFERLPADEQDAHMKKHTDLQGELIATGQVGPIVQLMDTTTAVTVRGDPPGSKEPPMVLDGPFAETKEQFLGFYMVDCATIEEAIEIAKKLPLGVAAVEVRPVQWFGGLPMDPAGDG